MEASWLTYAKPSIILNLQADRKCFLRPICRVGIAVGIAHPTYNGNSRPDLVLNPGSPIIFCKSSLIPVPPCQCLREYLRLFLTHLHKKSFWTK